MPEPSRLPEIGVALPRVSLGVLFLAHGVAPKLLTFGLPGTAAILRSLGLRGWLAYLTFAEVVGGLMLVLGERARLAAAALAPSRPSGRRVARASL